MIRFFTLGVLVGALLVAGCRVDTRPKVAVRHDAGDEPRLREAPYRGIFRLYLLPQAGDVAAGAAGAATRPAGRELLTESTLRRGERVGFVRNAQGQLVAIAGGASPLVLQQDRSYLWQMRAEPGQTDWGKTTGLVVVVVAVAAIVIVILIVQDVEDSLPSGDVSPI